MIPRKTREFVTLKLGEADRYDIGAMLLSTGIAKDNVARAY